MGSDPKRRAWRMAGLAAALVAAVLTAGVWAVSPGADGAGDVTGEGMIQAAVSRHINWMEGPAVDAVAGQEVTLAAFARRHGNVYVPDLGASKLHLVRSEPFGPGGVQVRYVGVHDCRLSLFIMPDAGAAPSPLREVDNPDARVFAWRANQLDYLLVAAGMDPTRLDLISKATYDATRNLQPFGPATQLALDLNHRRSRPCALG